MVKPDFDRAPEELARLHRWVLWRGKKVPYQASSPRITASSTNPKTWSSFEEARNSFTSPRDHGVGFVLVAEDGLACIDIDYSTSTEAVAMLRELNCRFIERSPSGCGLHGWGYCNDELARKKGRYLGLNIEIYRAQRYITYTGDVIDNGPLAPLCGVAALSRDLQKRTEENRGGQRMTEVIFSNLPCSSVGEFLPESEGQRNKCLFELARYLKGTRPNATKAELRSIVQEWHSLAFPVIGTKDFGVTWGDFLRGWDKVKFPHGETMARVLDGVEGDPIPQGVDGLGYGPQSILLAKVCRRLAEHHGDDPFFISARQAGELVNVHFTDAAKILSALVLDDVLKLERKGSGKVASRYWWTLPDARTDHSANR